MHTTGLVSLLINTLGRCHLRVSGIRLQLSQLLGLLRYLHVHHAAETSPHMTNIARSAVKFNLLYIVVHQDLLPPNH
jgi:hypothetical protein